MYSNSAILYWLRYRKCLTLIQFHWVLCVFSAPQDTVMTDWSTMEEIRYLFISYFSTFWLAQRWSDLPQIWQGRDFFRPDFGPFWHHAPKCPEILSEKVLVLSHLEPICPTLSQNLLDIPLYCVWFPVDQIELWMIPPGGSRTSWWSVNISLTDTQTWELGELVD